MNDGIHLAATYDGQELILFVDGMEQVKTPTGYVANTTQPLFIGAGAPFLPARNMVPAGTPSSPLFPWVGAIQDVAIYDAALDGGTIVMHFDNGQGKIA